MADNILVKVDNVSKHFHTAGGVVKAVNNVSFEIAKGETVGLVGESGCGKSTLGRTLMGIYQPTEGKIYFNNEEINIKKAKDRYKYAKKAQMIFQDPYASLNPRMTVGSIISEGMEIHNMYTPEKRKERVGELLDLVGLNKEYANRFPHEFSGGQRQRIGIARALAIEPEFLICDEPISALDVSIQSQKRLGLTYLFIAHDLDIVRYISDRIVVMYLGHVVEIGESNEVYSNALHPYSQALLSAVPIPDPELEREKKRIILEGDIPSPINLPKGCPFAGRCHYAKPECSESMPELKEVSAGHFVACHNINK